jgi:IstB-like ATP binding protein
VFGSERLTGALLDRLTHHVHILEMNGDSYRLSGRRSLIKGYFWRCADRGCGHVFGLVRGEFDPLALMLSANPLPRSEQRA